MDGMDYMDVMDFMDGRRECDWEDRLPLRTI